MKDPGPRFAELVQGPESDIALDEAALLIAAHAYPDMDIAEELDRLDGMARACPSADWEDLRRLLFDELGFGGAIPRHPDPRSSFLNDVVRRRTGIPISLSVLVMEVARRIGIELRGVGLPGHFLVARPDEPGVLIDPFRNGRSIDRDEAERLFKATNGPTASFEEEMLAPVGARAILARMLRNLRVAYMALGDARSTGWVLQLRAHIPAFEPEEKIELAGVHAALGRFAEAAALLDGVSEMVHSDDIAAQARSEANQLRYRLN